MAASSKIMFAAFPPNSNVYLLPDPAKVFMMNFPTSVEPVNATLFTSGCFTNIFPVSPPPVIIFTTPGGTSASRITSASFKAVRGVVSAGFKTTVLPAANAGAIFHAAINKGKFQGIICPATPNDFVLRPGKA